MRHQYIHAVDVVPTLYELLGIEPPAVIKGYTQSPIEGESFAAALTDPDRAREADAVLRDARAALDLPRGLARLHRAPADRGWGKFEHDEWELYDLEHDRAQSKNVAADQPGAARGDEGVCGSTTPASTTGCRSTTAPRSSRCSAERPRGGPDRSSTTYYPDAADVPESPAVAINGRSYTIAAGVDIDSADAEGVLFAHGGVAGGHSLYVKDKQAALHVQLGRHEDVQDIVAEPKSRRASTC